MSSQRSERVAVIGLGAMGLPIATNLAAAGVDVQVWNRSAGPREKAELKGCVPVSQLSDIDAHIVLTVLPDIWQVEEVLHNGLLKAMKPDDILVIMGTVSPVATGLLGKILLGERIRLVDAPVSGGDVGAQNATLSIMVGGSETDFNEVLPVFQKIGKTIRYVGPLGSGQLAKACNQIVVGITLSAIAEATTLARRSGLDTKIVLDILAGGLAGSSALDIKREKIESGDFTPGGMSAFQLKDLKFALEAGKATGTALPITSAVTDLYQALIDAGDGGLDHSGVIKEIERRSQ